MDFELAYRYAAASRLEEGGGLALATSGGSTPEGEAAHPFFFSGFMERPDVVAAGLLAVARVARTRFYVPPGMVVAPGGGLTRIGMLDPVVTSTAEGLRFESFSVCCGVYARLDVEASALDATHRAVGVTNVDVNQPLRAALASLHAGEPLHLDVGEEGLTATTLDEEVSEEKVPLSLRWLKGFAETQMLSSAMMPLHVLNTAQARAFVRGLPRTSATGTVMWAGRAVRGLRLGTRPAPGAACVAGPERLRVFEPLLHLITSLEAYGPPVDAGSEPVASLWVARMPGARLSVGLSPAKSRGFSGEGAVLASLGDPRVEEDADMLSALLSFEPRIDTERMAARAGLAPDRVAGGLALLASSGQVGFDVTEGAYFHRPLPVRPDALTAMHPRLAGARTLIERGAVTREEGARFRVSSGANRYRVEVPADPYAVGEYRCTCPWWMKHRGGRGPCKHVLAVSIMLKEES